MAGAGLLGIDGACLQWLCQGALWRPTKAQALCQRLRSHAKRQGPIRDVLRDAVVRQQDAVRTVAALLGFGCPSAVSWLVAQVIFDPLHRHVFAGALPHVFKEGSEVVPAFANFDSATSISGIANVLWIIAALHHRLPACIGERAVAAVFGVARVVQD